MMAVRTHIDPTLPPIDLEGVTADSRAVEQGFLFAALPGTAVDGRRFIGDAIKRGATAILAPPGTDLPADQAGIVLVTDDDPRRRLALIAADYYGAQPETVTAVTGTNGKTSVAFFTRHLWSATGRKAASLGTLGILADGLPEQPGLTTPEPVTLHAQLADIAEAGISHLALEASSHGLAQRRLDGVKIAAAGFTNLSRDHLDYHASFEEYFAAKARLFDTCVAEGGLAVINADSDQAEALSDIATRRNLTLIGYGASGREFRVVARQPTPGGCELELEILGQTAKVDLPLIGSYQTANALCALGLAMADTALSADTLIDGLASLPSVPGRLEKVGVSARGGAVYVDYAHTPDALETVLKALREHTAGTLGVVFGCGGDRDPGKRPQMGRAAATLADWAIVTDDNPRTEDPASIRAEALAACPDAREIGDRRQAIEAAIEALQDGDVLVLAGKGHEPYQIVGEQTLPFDDRDVARETLAASGGTA